ncbi:hypothetical protein CWI25_16730 [Pseudomonas aeruginosa]|uniref:DUF2800 domain-containing protein n=1 Tax=Pseudomonas aeruginosa TaxID=287 RepID=UPI000C2B7D5E|nr:DUF2800 domain-containing protein [Pseudomonas aeruginosa]AUA71574.1 hypothetical protein CWI25_16730 [Pseudomonas aeruginosa]AUA96132.1 hypothetical protein CWI24_16890 [Pseudomonas aeruginosa]HBO0103453.1 DUF2800 domain-containing protein [Pseudomonas aeruginosa]HBO9091765.1 DUF2800 domain-containing protein [Pseudomonas aeruginosa]HCF0562210.1 DUF2800 domain-containing protein [Pseudomonas aeruginosa]
MADHGFDLAAVQRKLGGHSVFAPSASAMWLLCSGSLIPNLLAEDEAGEDAAYGTVAHGVAERWLKTGIKPVDLVGTVELVAEHTQTFEIEIDHSMLDYVQQYVDWCTALPGDHFVEQRVDFSRLTPIPDQGGTADHIACLPGLLVITDLKMGKGVQVFAKRNTQALLYALGSFYRWDWEYGFQRVIIRIAQPRLDHFDEWEVSRDELLEFAEYAKERAHAAWAPNAPRTPGEKQCQWCRVKASCTAFAAHMESLLAGVFDDLDDACSEEQVYQFIERLEDEFDEFTLAPAPLQTLSTSQKAKIYRWRKAVENWFKSLEDDLEKTLQAGNPVPGYKVVEGRSNRFFRDPSSVPETLEMLTGVPAEKFIATSVRTPAQVEEILKKEGGYRAAQLPELLEREVLGVTKPRGKPVMAPAHDKRAELTLTVDDVFDDLEGEGDL